MAVLARHLEMRGHQTVFLHQTDARPVLKRAGGSFHPLWAPGPNERLDDLLRRMARPDGFGGLRAIIRDGARLTDRICAHAPAVLRNLGVDAVIADQLEPAGGLVARHLGLPFASVANALPIDPDPDLPPPFLPWRYRPTSYGRWRNRGAERVARWLLRPQGEVIASWAARWRLGSLSAIADCLSERQVAQAVAGLDFPRPPRSDFLHAGPFRDDGRPSEERPWAGDSRPLVFCSLGTLQDHRSELFARIAEACRLQDLRLVVAHGGGLGDARLPGDPLVLRDAPQRAVLRDAALAVCHAGFNTVLDALSFGVPILALPLGFEQPGTAARLAYRGAGKVAGPSWSARRLARAMAELLEDPGPRRAAARLAAEIAGSGGAGRAAAVIEAWTGSA